MAETLKQGAIDADKELLTEIHQYYYANVPVGNDWIAPMNGAAKANSFVNTRRESAYFGQEYDADKKRPNGTNAHTITFPKGGPPPCGASGR